MLDFEIRWQACVTPSYNDLLVGFGHGNGAVDPGSMDISMGMPFSTLADNAPLALQATGRPALGQTLGLETSNYGSAPFGVCVLSFRQFPQGVPLAALGMAGCSQYVGLDAKLLFIAAGPTATVNIGMPVNTALLGATFYSQSLTFTPGFNSMGLIASNGLQVVLGDLRPPPAGLPTAARSRALGRLTDMAAAPAASPDPPAPARTP